MYYPTLFIAPFLATVVSLLAFSDAKALYRGSNDRSGSSRGGATGEVPVDGLSPVQQVGPSPF